MGEANRTTEVIRVSKQAARTLRRLRSDKYMTIAAVIDHLLEEHCIDYHPEENYQEKYYWRAIRRH